MKMIKIFILINFVQIAFSETYSEKIFYTSYGQVKGRLNQLVDSKFIISLIGVPYASPPTGQFRFQEPQALKKWEGVYDATNKKVSCIQFGERFESLFDYSPQNEDCLYLNIHILNNRSPNLPFKAKLPVIVYIHGGEFNWGSKDIYSMTKVPNEVHGVIFITLNYRLGPLGFLSFNNDNIYGNYGLRDIIFALRWVKQEIANFDGDSTKITIYGHDAGAVLVSMLILATYKENLFHKAISSSGTVFTPWAWNYNPSNTSFKLVQALDCSIYGGYPTLKCLQKASVKNLQEHTFKLDLKFRPTVDKNLANRLFEDEPLNQYMNGNYAQVSYLAGINENEGLLDYNYLLNNINHLRNSRSKIQYIVEHFYDDQKSSKAISHAIYYQYFATLNGPQYTPLPEASILTHIISNFLYEAPTSLALICHSLKNVQTSFYLFKNSPSQSFKFFQKNFPLDNSATHFDDIFAMLDINFSKNVKYSVSNSKISPREEKLFKNFKTCLFSFMDIVSLSCSWTDYKKPTYSYLLFDGSSIFSQTRDQKNEMFWNYLIFNLRSLNETNENFPYVNYRTYQRATWTLTGLIILLLIIAFILLILAFKERKNRMKTITLLSRRNELSESHL